VKTSCVTQCFEKLFSTYLNWVFSWFLNLESWILILIILESWNLILESLLLEICLTLDSFGIIKITLEDIASTKTPSQRGRTALSIYNYYSFNTILVLIKLNQTNSDLELVWSFQTDNMIDNNNIECHQAECIITVKVQLS